ncbi:UNVERIFIED_CONTAM: hypothetical protein HDU68_000253 [Siphonaria sp. JEL0065]|nr:hypothetical protein HDU68_000253 [Siphonaria sp. JEL0065]
MPTTATNEPVFTLLRKVQVSAPELSQEQTDKIAALTANVPELIAAVDGITPEETATLTQFADDRCIRRYLTATKWDLDAAIAKLQGTLVWRKEYKPDQINANEVEIEAECGKGYMTGFDKAGQPVIYAVARLDVTKTWDRALRFALFMIERGLKVADKEGTEKLCIVLDNEGLGVFNAPPVSFVTQFLGITEKHYPERLGSAIMLSPTWVIWGLYKLVSPFLDPVVKSKVYFATITKPEEEVKLKKSWSVANMFGKVIEEKEEAESSSSEDVSGTGGWVKIESLIDVSQLPVQYGGSFNFEYQHESYWKAVTAL